MTTTSANSISSLVILQAQVPFNKASYLGSVWIHLRFSSLFYKARGHIHKEVNFNKIEITSLVGNSLSELLQIRRANRDNLRIIVRISASNIYCDPSLESSQ